MEGPPANRLVKKKGEKLKLPPPIAERRALCPPTHWCWELHWTHTKTSLLEKKNSPPVWYAEDQRKRCMNSMNYHLVLRVRVSSFVICAICMTSNAQRTQHHETAYLKLICRNCPFHLGGVVTSKTVCSLRTFPRLGSSIGCWNLYEPCKPRRGFHLSVFPQLTA